METVENWEIVNYYLILQKKLPRIILTQYQRWIYGKRRWSSEDTLREWIIRRL